MITDPQFLLRAALLSEVSYETNSRTDTEALGVDWIGQVGDSGCLATLCRVANQPAVIWQGTRVTENTDLAEIWADLDPAIVNLPGLGFVAEGLWSPMSALFEQIEKALGQTPWWSIGHSLGGDRAHLSAARWPQASIISFGAPCAASNDFWLNTRPHLVRVVNENDFAPDWRPGLNPFWTQPPGPFTWLHNGQALQVTERPGLNLSVAAHSCASGYIPALAKLA